MVNRWSRRPSFLRLQFAAWLCSVSIWLYTGGAHANARSDSVQRSALALELRLLAPCCWVQTLDVHESDLATALRQEISERIARGVPSQAIEDDLAARYGERIRAVPKGADPRSAIPLTVGIAMLVSVVLLTVLALHWRRRRERPDPRDAPTEEDDQYGQALEEELHKL